MWGSVVPPSSVQGLTVTSGDFLFTNVSTGVETSLAYNANSLILNLADGLYNVTFLGEGTYVNGTSTAGEEVKVQGVKQNVEVIGGTCHLAVEVYIVGYEKADFVIAEIYGVGSYINETNKQYNGDQYFKIHNNAADTLYADGLVLLESKFLTVTKYDYTPNIMDEAMTVQVVAMVPGSGKDYPVAPGQSIIICDNAINHTESNNNSFDLSKADFEWYTSSSSTSTTDVDNPAVPNMEMLYNYTKTIWVLHKMGSKAYAIGRLGVSADTYVKDYTYTYTYIMANGKESSVQTEYKFPNDWIIDAVNLGAKNNFVWGLVHASLDMGFTYYGENTTIAENVGKAVQRKVTYQDADRVFYQDTNNSTADFHVGQRPSLATK